MIVLSLSCTVMVVCCRPMPTRGRGEQAGQEQGKMTMQLYLAMITHCIITCCIVLAICQYNDMSYDDFCLISFLSKL